MAALAFVTSRALLQVIARIGRLQKLNGSVISAAERQDAEIRYLRRATGRTSATHQSTGCISCLAGCVCVLLRDVLLIARDLTFLDALQVTCSSPRLRLKNVIAVPGYRSCRKGVRHASSTLLHAQLFIVKIAPRTSQLHLERPKVSASLAPAPFASPEQVN